jgi:hypothetical protein
MKIPNVALTLAESNHLLELLYAHLCTGEYWGRKDHHHRRTHRIIAKIEATVAGHHRREL